MSVPLQPAYHRCAPSIKQTAAYYKPSSLLTMAEKKAFTFTVDELELVSFLRDGRGALEEEVDVDWDLNR